MIEHNYSELFFSVN